MNRAFDVIVIGAGPAGSTAATFLSRAGLRTLLVDKARFPRDKSCGDAVCSKSVAILRELGLAEALERLGAHRADREVFFNRRGDGLWLDFVTPRGRFAEGPTQRSPPGKGDLVYSPAYVVPRRRFDELLFRHAASQPGVTVREQTRLERLIFRDGRVAGAVLDVHGMDEAIEAPIVVGADGAFSRVAEQVGAYDFHHKHHEHWIAAFRIYFDDVGGLDGALEIHFLDELLPGYLWIFPEGGGRANVGAGLVEAHARGGRGRSKFNLRQVGYSLLREHPRLRERFRGAHEIPGSFLGWQLPCGSERRRIGGRGWLLVGDAASLVDPFSGEGIANAMHSAQLAAQACARALAGNDPPELFDYERAVWAAMGGELETSARLQRWVRHSWLVDHLIHRASVRAPVREAIVELAAQPARAAGPLQLAKLLVH